MALLNCPECMKQISKSAKACPKCGFDLHDKNNFKNSPACKKCGSYRTLKGMSPWILFWSAFLGTGLLIWIPIIGWIGGAFLFLFSIVYFFVALSSSIKSKKMFTCLDCGKRFYEKPVNTNKNESKAA